MPNLPSESRGPTVASGDRAANYGAINTGVIVNIRGERKKAIAGYFRNIAQTLGGAAEALGRGVVPHGKCGEMAGYAHQMSADVIDQQQAAALSQKLMDSYAVEHFGEQFMHLAPAERDAKFGGLDEAAGYFRAAARSLQVQH